MGWVESWVDKFTWQWVGLGWISYLVGWVGSMKTDPRTTPLIQRDGIKRKEIAGSIAILQRSLFAHLYMIRFM